MKTVIVMALALASGCTAAWANDTLGKKASDDSPSMRFEWHGAGSSTCRDCASWIYAVGPIAERTPKDFELFIADKEARGATVVLNSVGGSVSGAIALGRMMRALDMNTTVGRAVPSKVAGSPQLELLPDASCSSMCAFLLLAGKERHVPAQAKVKVHQIWLADKNKNILDNRYTADELALVQRDIARLARYEWDMTGAIELLERALQVPAWGPMHELSADELARTKLKATTEVIPVSAAPLAAGLAATR
jgi:hypothetical protein